ncbi:MAG: RNA polymerase sigma factor [Limnochordia bacterium]|jgi:RNA polymerase sigma-70 factor (ECF subfamily)
MEPVEALKQGDKEAISWLVDSFSQRLLKAAALILGDQHLAEDAVQDCLVDAISHISSFRGDASVYTWLYAILLRRCRRMRRSLSVKIDQLSSDDVEPVLFRSGNYGRLPPVEGRMQVREAISALDHKYREAIVLFYYEEFSIKEMAQLLGVPEGTVKNRLHRAREKLRLLLESEEEICL